MKYSKKIREKAVQGFRKLISEGHSKKAAVSAISELTDTPIDLLEQWLAEHEASQRSHLAPVKKVDKLKDFRDRRMSRKRHPDDAKLEEIQDAYLKLNYDF